MKAVILDGYHWSPTNIKWKGFTDLCDCTFYEFTLPEQLIERASDADIIITNKTGITAEIINQLPKLKYIGVLATGYNIVDVAAAKAKNIIVTNIPAYSTQSVAQMTIAHLLNITMQVAYHAGEVKKGRWCRSRDFCFWDTPLIGIDGLTIGLVGLGNVGMAVAHLAIAFKMQVIAYTSKSQDELPSGIKKTDLDTLLSNSDVVSLHCPLNEETKNLINKKTLSLMKRSSILINTARGGLIDETALAESLNTGKIYAAGVDVLSSEPPKEDNPLLTAKNCFVTPHYAWATRESRKRLMEIALANLNAFIEGNPINNIAE